MIGIPDQAILTTLTQLKAGLARGDNDFSAVRALRSDLGDIIYGYYKGANAAVGAKGVGPLQGLKNAVEQDMSGFARSSGGDLARAWHRADDFYKSAVVPFKDRPWRWP